MYYTSGPNGYLLITLQSIKKLALNCSLFVLHQSLLTTKNCYTGIIKFGGNIITIIINTCGIYTSQYSALWWRSYPREDGCCRH